MKVRQKTGDMMSPIRLLLLSEFQQIEANVLAAIRSDPDLILIARAASLAAALMAYDACAPDVVVLDARTAPVEVVQAVRRQCPAVKVLVCGLSIADAREMLRAGAGGYLLRDSACAELAGAVRSVYAGHVAVSLMLTRQLVG
jgi:DNA-binding NarL/FixJ family response regulator